MLCPVPHMERGVGYLAVHDASLTTHAGVQLGTLPSVELLGGLEELPPSHEASHGAETGVLQPQASVSQALAGASTLVVPESTAVKASAWVSLGAGLPAIPRRMLDMALAGEYVDFAELPPARGKARSVPQSLEGQILIVQASDFMQSRKVIPDLATWVQCFALYAAAVTSKHPARWSDLMAYMSNIAKASQQFVWPSWVVYDQNFRQEAANTPGMTWAKVDPSIYAQCFTGMAASSEGWCRQCHSIEHPLDRCPDAPPWDPVPHQGQSKGASIRKRPWPVLPSTSTKRATPSGPSDLSAQYGHTLPGASMFRELSSTSLPVLLTVLQSKATSLNRAMPTSPS